MIRTQKLTPDSDQAARKAFAKRLNAHITRSNLSHRRLAARARVSPQSITNWTQAEVEPNLRQLRGLSSALGVPVAALVEDDDDPPPPSVEQRILDELMALELRPAVERLGDSVPTLLDLLAEAERRIADRKDS